MRDFRWCLIAVVSTGVWTQQVFAQSASLSIEAEIEQLTPGQIFTVEVRADVENGDPEQIRLPDLSAFEVLEHEVSTPMQFSFRLGLKGAVRTMRSSVVHRFQLRAPPTSGRYAIGPARLRIRTKVYQSNIITVVVAGVGSAPLGPTQSPTAHPPPVSDLTSEVDSKAFIRAVVDNPTPYVGEQVTVSFFLYLAVALRSSPVVVQEPSAQGFWVQDLLRSSRAPDPSVQVINGQSYRAYLLRRLAAFPLEAGKLELGSMRVTVPVGSVFDMFGGSPAQDLDRSSKLIALHVKALPSHGPPMDAPLHVGSLALLADVDRVRVSTGDAVRLRLTATGSGHLVGLGFALAPIDGLQILQPETHDEVRTHNSQVTGTRATQWLIVPQRAGTYSVPAFVAHVWDPIRAAFSLVKSEPVRFEAVGKTLSHATPNTGINNEVTPLWGPIRHRSQLRRRQPPIAASSWYLAAVALPFLFTLVVYARQLPMRRANARSAKGEAKVFDKLQRKIKQLDATLSRTDPDVFYRDIAQLLRAGVEATVDANMGNLTRNELSNRLEAHGLPPALCQQCLSLLEQADHVRFAATAISRELMQSHLAETTQIVQALKEARP